MKKSTLRGFTLVEISIVLVVVGLIIGGVLVGRDLIKAAEVNSVISDISAYKTAVYAFKDKYHGLPGDIDNASSYWPDCDANPANCNDNKDGIINDALPWFHLSLAELIPGSYPIITSVPVPGTDVPMARLNNAGYGLTYGFPYARLGNYFSLSKSRSDGTLEGASTGIQAQMIDRKIDDDAPATGDMFVVNQQDTSGTWQTTGCVEGGDLLSASSAISWTAGTSDAEECVLIFYFD